MKHRPAMLGLALALALSLPLATATHAQVVNGSFEPAAPFGSYALLAGGSTAIPGWTTTDTGVEWFNPAAFGSGSAYDGSYIVDLANYVYSAGGVQQTLATVPGAAYAVTFRFGTHAASGRDGTAQIVVSAGATTQVFSTTNPGATIAWQPCTFAFTATGSTTTLAFRCLQNANLHFAYIDGVGGGMTTAAAPGTWGAIKGLYR